jgi:hypothetical protein
MTADVFFPRLVRRRRRGFLWLPVTALAAIVIVAACFVAYVLWPTWPGKTIPLDAPALPITVAGVLFDVPPAAIRVAVQRQPGPHERIDLVFLWPSLVPPAPFDKAGAEDHRIEPGGSDTAAVPPSTRDRLFVTVAGLGAVLPPLERLRSIYPRYVEAAATAGPDGLAVLPFRAGTPYSGEDLIYVADNPEQFFARCTRTVRAVPGTCLQEHLIGAAEITTRFPRDWLDQWRNVAAGFDRLVTQLHPGG